MLNKKTGNIYEFFQFFFLILKKSVYQKMFELYLRIISIDYPETSLV